MSKTIQSGGWRIVRVVGIVVILAAVFGGGFLVRGFWTSSSSDAQTHVQTHDGHQHTAQASTSGSKMWTCSMHPQIQQPEPGNCPICGMKLIPVTSSGGGIRQISLDPETIKLMDLKTSPVERRFVSADVRMVGKVTYDETRVKRITAWVGGRLDRLFVDFTGIPVKEGHHMVLLYSPELYSAQTELLQALKFNPPGNPPPADGIDLVESAREKLRLYGMTVEQIKEIVEKGKASYQLTINAPIGGIVVEKHRNQGDYVKIGNPIYTIADLSHLWVQFDAYEADLQWIRYGQEVMFTTEAYPGEQFVGRIAFKDPVLNEKTRTVKVRVNVPNPDGKLRPEMLVHGVVRSQIAAGGRVMDPSLAGKWISPMHPSVVKDEPGKCPFCGMELVRAESLGYVPAESGGSTKPLVVPKSAVLITGTRAIVYVELPGTKVPTYEGREIVLGPRAGDYYLVRSGLKEGELVVTNGNFKLDSDLQIKAKPSMMTPEGGGASGHDHGGHGAKGSDKASSPGSKKSKIPGAFHSQLGSLQKAALVVEKSVQTGDMPKIKDAFAEFGKSLHKVDIKLLEGHAHLMWGELAMLLHNDVVEGHNATTIQQAKKALSQLEDHMRRVRDQFAHEHTDHGFAGGTVPPAFQIQLGKVWRAYGPLQEALAKDSLAKATQAIIPFEKALAQVEGKQLPEKAQPFWSKEVGQLQSIVRKMKKADKLDSLREQFSSLSGSLLAAIRVYGIKEAGTVYELHCSMAFNNRGASWLQDDNKPRNPYFGAAMPACADRVQLIAGKEKELHGGRQHHE